ncbi:MAG: hypothetical protein ACI9GM_000930 [Salibacteraceae bacterium]|jgi:hypothetical protein
MRVYNRVLAPSERVLVCDINYVDPVLAAPVVSNDLIVCMDSIFVLNAIPDSGVVYWESPLGTQVATGNSFVTSTNQNRTYHVYSVLNGIYSDTAMINVGVLNCANFLSPVGPSDTTVCIDSLVIFSASADSGVIYWESPLGTVIGTGNTITTSFANTAVVYLYSLSNGNYSDTSSFNVSVQNCSNFSAPDGPGDTLICENDYATFMATADSGTIYWETPLGTVHTIGNSFSDAFAQTTNVYFYSKTLTRTSDTGMGMG